MAKAIAQTHGFTGIQITEGRVRANTKRKTPAPAKTIARAAVHAQFGDGFTVGRIMAQGAGWMEWEIIPV